MLKQPPLLTDAERKQIDLLLVEPNSGVREQLLTLLRALGLNSIADCNDHTQAIEKLRRGGYTHLIFSATRTTMGASAFLSEAMRTAPEIVALPASMDPDVDEILDLMLLGARAYLAIPVSLENLENVLTIATKTEPARELALAGSDKNRAIAGMLVNVLDSVATVMKRAKLWGTEPHELPELMAKFRETAEMAQVFCKGGEMELLDTLQNFCIAKADKAAGTRLGQIRQRLALLRQAERAKKG